MWKENTNPHSIHLRSNCPINLCFVRFIIYFQRNWSALGVHTLQAPIVELPNAPFCSLYSQVYNDSWLTYPSLPLSKPFNVTNVHHFDSDLLILAGSSLLTTSTTSLVTPPFSSILVLVYMNCDNENYMLHQPMLKHLIFYSLSSYPIRVWLFSNNLRIINNLLKKTFGSNSLLLTKIIFKVKHHLLFGKGLLIY